MYEVCVLTKFRNKRAHQVSEKKLAILTLIFIDVYDQLFLSHEDYVYFLEIINNYSRKVWTISLKRREDAFKTLLEWRVKVELQSEAKVMTVRSNNAIELKATLNKWCAFFDIAPQYIVPYMFIQNDVAERAIQITENSVQAMIKNAELSIEFWVKAAQTDTYLRNRTSIDSIVDNKSTSSEEAFIEEKSFIDHVRVWDCKYYSYIDVKSLSTENKRDKFMNREKVRVFMSYVNETAKRYHLWASNLERVITSHVVRFNENEKEGSIKLKLKMSVTSNVLLKRRSVKKSRKNSVLTSVSLAMLKTSMTIASITFDTSENNTHSVSEDSKQKMQNKMKIKLSSSDLKVSITLNAEVSKFMKVMKQFSHVEISKRRKKKLVNSDLKVSIS